jgi:hypothetical protein
LSIQTESQNPRHNWLPTAMRDSIGVYSIGPCHRVPRSRLAH